MQGVIVEGGTGTRLTGAMVVLFDSDGEAIDRVLTDALGGFVMPSRHLGRYHVRVDRIGYASLTTDPFDLPERGTFRRIEVQIRPIRLRGLDVSGSRRCEIRPEEGRVTDRSGEIVLESSTATIAGSVQDSLTVGRAASATVRVLGTREEREVEADGSFLLPGLAGGLHKLVVRHTLLDTLGLPAKRTLTDRPRSPCREG
ncbi:MAG: carboxypeptidase regulatory-like domain-containing protein [Chloroflexi bacterium]|nr:carboxypeptidase regulatory-like domain-containing protein [Chloroflexota bacterium]